MDKSIYTIVSCIAVFLAFPLTPLYAGGGPENVFLVVNSADPDSLAVANLFIDFRAIPEGSVFYVRWPDAPFDTELDTFRERILKPTLDEIQKRQLTNQIDYIIYSSGFPYAINFSTALGDGEYDRNPVGSLTGLTYLHQYTTAGKLGAISGSMAIPSSAMNSNAYAKNLGQGREGKTHGFRARYGLDLMGNRVGKWGDGQRYYLSMMLAHTGGSRNNTLDQITRYLRNGKKADGTEPNGTIYFVKNSNVRSTVRHDKFPSVVAQLKALGVNAEEIQGATGEKNSLPLDKDDVQGAVVGYHKVAWGITNSKILPGAIVENFTSYGGVMSGRHGQTMLSLFLRYGAVASSGTVVEPYAHAAKFPDPRMHVHYARGCSVAEAFYQSVMVPYQLLIVGDPLCQPWGVAPEVKVRGLNTKKTVTGTIQFRAEAKSKKGHKIRNFEVFVDGTLLKRALPNEAIEIDTNRLANGYHELRVVAVEDTPIETQGRYITGFVSANLPADINPSDQPMLGVAAKLINKDGLLRIGQPGFVRVESEGAREIRIYRGRELLGLINGPKGRITIDPSRIGSGRAVIRAVALPKNRSLKPVFGFPLQVTVQ